MDTLIPSPRAFPGLPGGAPSLPMSLQQEFPCLLCCSTLSLLLSSFFSLVSIMDSGLCRGSSAASPLVFCHGKGWKVAPSNTRFPGVLGRILKQAPVLLSWSFSFLHLSFPGVSRSIPALFPSLLLPDPAGKHLAGLGELDSFHQEEPDAF